MSLYKKIKNNVDETTLDYIIDSVLKKNHIKPNTRIFKLSDETFDKLVGQVRDVFGNRISEKEIKNSLAKKLFNLYDGNDW